MSLALITMCGLALLGTPLHVLQSLTRVVGVSTGLNDDDVRV